jgi:hypothetical protein
MALGQTSRVKAVLLIMFIASNNGGCTLTARVLNLKNTQGWLKAALMIRKNDLPGSVFVLVDICPDGQAELLLHRAPVAMSRQGLLWQGGIVFKTMDENHMIRQYLKTVFKLNNGKTGSKLKCRISLP